LFYHIVKQNISILISMLKLNIKLKQGKIAQLFDCLGSTSNVTGRHRGPKRKLQAAYRAPSRHRRALGRQSYCCLLDVLHCNARQIFHRRVCYRTISLRCACIRSSGMILIPATFVPNFVFCCGPIAGLAARNKGQDSIPMIPELLFLTSSPGCKWLCDARMTSFFVRNWSASFNTLKCSSVRQLHFEVFSAIQHPSLTYIINFWHSGTLALRAEGQIARMSEIKNVG